MPIERFDIYANCNSTIDEYKSQNGPYIRIEDLVEYLQEQIRISATNMKAFEEEYQGSDPKSNTFKWQMIESMKSESEMNAFILVLQALGKNPIKETK